MSSRHIQGALLVGACLRAATASADTPGDARDLTDARASGGSLELERRGHVHAGSSKAADRSYGMWRNPSSRSCVTVATMSGRCIPMTEANGRALDVRGIGHHPARR